MYNATGYDPQVFDMPLYFLYSDPAINNGDAAEYTCVRESVFENLLTV